MKRLSFFLLLITVSFSSFAQEKKDQSILQIVGRSEISVKPDLGVLIISISHINKDFNQTLLGLNNKTKDVSKQLTGLGFKDEDIKTTNFQITENRIYRREQYIDSGFIATQNVEVEFKNQKETITKILGAFSKSKTDFDLRFDFKLSDPLKAKSQNDVIKLAVEDAKQKAQVLATAAGVKLKKIKDINYGQAFYTTGMQESYDVRKMQTMNADAEAVVGFIPKDLVFTDSVTICWELEQ